MNYLDFLPKELLAYLIPNDYVYTTLQVFNDQDRYQIFVDFINLNYPDYFHMMKRESSYRSFHEIMKELYEIYISYKINDVKLLIPDIQIRYFEIKPFFTDNIFYNLYPIILINKYPQVSKYYLNYKLTEQDYGSNKFVLRYKNSYNRELLRDIIFILLLLEDNDFSELLKYELSDPFKIKLLHLSGIKISELSITIDDLDEIRNTDLGAFLISKQINVV
jgi:hypothetical protein